MKNVTTLELINQARNEDLSTHIRKRAQGELYNRFCKYIFKFANKWKTHSPQVNFDTLVSAGQMGLLKAIDTFDTSHGTYFSTWAYSNVQMAIWHALKDGKSIPKYYKAIGVSATGDSEDREFDVAEEPTKTFRLTNREEKRLHEIVENVLGKHLEKYCIVVARFGLHGEKPLSNQECCKVFNVTPHKVSSAVRYFKQKAIAKYGDELKAMYTIQ